MYPLVCSIEDAATLLGISAAQVRAMTRGRKPRLVAFRTMAGKKFGISLISIWRAIGLSEDQILVLVRESMVRESNDEPANQQTFPPARPGQPRRARSTAEDDRAAIQRIAAATNALWKG